MSRVGSYEWAKRNGGALSKSERRRLAGQIVKGYAELVAHRTWIYGLALAALDGTDFDREHLYFAALLHDAGISEQVDGEDFTIRSAETALAAADRAGADEAARTAIADGICGHITPGASVAADGPIASYVQDGAVADLVGLRRRQIHPDVRERAEEQHPPEGTGRAVGKLWKAESKAVPAGRAAVLQRYGSFSNALRFGPVR